MLRTARQYTSKRLQVDNTTASTPALTSVVRNRDASPWETTAPSAERPHERWLSEKTRSADSTPGCTKGVRGDADTAAIADYGASR